MSADIVNISGLDCYEENGVVYLNLEQAARGLGFTEQKNGKDYIMWRRVDGYLHSFGTSAERPAYIPENIFYRLAMKAKSEAAERFQAWVADEVIPSIRRRGMYATGATVERFLNDPDFAIRLFSELKRERDEKQALQAKIDADAPKVLYSDMVAGSKTGMLIREFAKFLRENGVDTGEKRLYEDLRRRGFLIKAEGRDRNKPTQRAMDMGLFSIRETTVSKPSGETVTRTTPLLTGKGRQYFANLYLSEKAEAAP